MVGDSVYDGPVERVCGSVYVVDAVEEDHYFFAFESYYYVVLVLVLVLVVLVRGGAEHRE